ncbi:Hsp20/alpha crystallin family protein [Methylotenera sp.]|uniref:Hsp20/alpha crystallin family protein n=1 Tax=Methylotenera sp. TaxID=2051956 RepID=UPI002730E8B0|nr:Hsp20/alpha crystallin family protein [Methylotenera sp.]MDP2231627.1 Hsp20/alpha crystallin family protein [Methylotenera sp.]MDP3140845.1 Hsp20/alpha crystallin family protein [Methylotenera sp.]
MDDKVKGNIPVTTSGKEVAKSSRPGLHPIAEMERAFDRFFGRGWPSSLLSRGDTPAVDSLFEFEGHRLPSLDVIDRDAEIVVRAEIPGIDKKDINVSLADNVLTIKGQTSTESKEEKGDYYRHEISSSSFARSVTVPGVVDGSKVVANLKDGILEVKLAKTAASKRQNIQVQ